MSSLRDTVAALVISLLLLAGKATAGIYEDLLKAIEGNDTQTVTDILQRGMDVNTVDKSGNSLLMLAIEKGNADLVRFLVAHRAKVNVRNQYGDTPLMLASLKGGRGVVQ